MNGEQNHLKNRKISSLVVTPTRELAIQIEENFKAYSKYTHIRSTVIFGGVSQYSQTRALKNGIDILIATPGRLLDLINQGYISLKGIKYFVLDEADRMLDMGFIHIKKIIQKLQEKTITFFLSYHASKYCGFIKTNISNQKSKCKSCFISAKHQTIFIYIAKDKKKSLLHILNDPKLNKITFTNQAWCQ